MQAIILAAGMGKRLKHLTASNTKCMLNVNGITLIERLLAQLEGLELKRIVIVVGYESGKLIDFIDELGISTPIEYIVNPIFDKTNNIYSLFLAKDRLIEDDTLLLESDLIFEDGILQELVDDPRPTLALVDKYESWMDGTVVKIDEHDDIVAFIPGKKFVFDDISEYYKTVNIYKFSRSFSRTHYVPFLEAYSQALGNNEYYEQVLRVITMLDDAEVKAKRLAGKLWYEIDDLQDLDIAESMFAPNDEERLSLLQNRFGGYWRYPNLIDFCYLVNPYYPPQRLMDEMKSNFEKLLTQYPSGMRVNALLAAKNFGVNQDCILVGNGAAELIRSLLSVITGRIGIVRPTFEEYPNRCTEASVVVFQPDNENFSYTEEDLISFYSINKIDILVLINPDNPSGNYLPKKHVENLASWCEDNSVRLILDESFADFSNETDCSFIRDKLLERYPHLVVVKSISKSYGVPGARLGVLASFDKILISALKKDLAIWNINSFGEFYLQIAEKYKSDYAQGLDRFRSARDRLTGNLSRIGNLRVIPSQANYLMVEVLGSMTATQLTRRLLSERSLLVKDLTGKIDYKGRQYIRVAIRNEEDNDILVAALRELLE
ncbi:aminotransferase class I/II-fold pyridoxal phosphate-dependent enzyme [Arabiibacter massiliensis]|uniref:aminotransferase class I/II-fold pyridoxal phosphate-dependent enzyme n=1 Tax=Arabiibacter massiliensis TaxID=1870985 RepID=UPI0009BA056D|nr:aminotransferase class I/II-fold pyridoxal phosphate-dependent enzyme [Arabiibacter massiliensis]